MPLLSCETSDRGTQCILCSDFVWETGLELGVVCEESPVSSGYFLTMSVKPFTSPSHTLCSHRPLSSPLLPKQKRLTEGQCALGVWYLGQDSPLLCSDSLRVCSWPYCTKEMSKKVCALRIENRFALLARDCEFESWRCYSHPRLGIKRE